MEPLVINIYFTVYHIYFKTDNRKDMNSVYAFQRIQLTAVTPTNCAVRLETGCVDLQLSNRVENVSGRDTAQPNTSKLFAKANVEINLSLGQLIRNALFEEAEPEFQQYAFFKTRIGKLFLFL